ncbi:MAG: hypothetical protein FJ368_05840, partial [Pelagibacterales bacterium]|nr:hypothetical protein [Pelagibacterales bacterium]
GYKEGRAYDLESYAEMKFGSNKEVFLNAVKNFDSDFYLMIYGDVRNAINDGKYKATALHHFIANGYKEGRAYDLESYAEMKFPNNKAEYVILANNFDEDFYLSRYVDVKNAINNGSYKANALHHFLNYGYKEGRVSSADYANTKKGTINSDVINGDDYNNIIRGDAGDDIINGKKGSDLLTGGQGNDIFKYSNLNESTINTADIITDFTKSEDKIDLSSLDFITILREDQLNQENNLNFSSEQVLTYSYDQENNQTIIQNQDFQIKLIGNINLDEGDFGF